MGYGEVGGNGSVHWRVRHEEADKGSCRANKGTGESEGEDKIDPAQVGVKKGAPAGHFRVEVMYDRPGDAQAALQSAVVQGSSLVLFVRANTAKLEPKKVPAQIRVSW